MSNDSGKGCCSFFRRMEDKILLSPKIIYFVVSAAFYAFYMFRAKFIKDYLMLKSDQYGDLAAIMALVSFAFMTLWGSFADALGRHRLVLAGLCILLALSLELCMFIVDFGSQTVRFVLSIGVLSLYSFFACGLMPLADYLTLRILTDKPGFNKDMYGRQRLWGTISYGITTYVVGIILDKAGLSTMFYIVPTCSLLAVAVLFCLAPSDRPKPLSEVFSRISKKAAQKQEEQTAIDNSATTLDVDEKKVDEAAKATEDDIKKPKRPILQLLGNPNYIFMLFAVFMTGSARAVMTTFLGKYWDDRGLESNQIGICANFGIVMEIVIFFFGPLCIRTIGTYWMLMFAQLAMVLRCWAYVILPVSQRTVWLVYGVELLKGVAFGFTQISGVKLASDAAPKGLEATAQALYTSVYSQLPAVLTAFAGGRVYGSMGPYYLFLITAIVMTVALVLFTVKYVVDGSIRFPCQKARRAHDQHQPPMVVAAE